MANLESDAFVFFGATGDLASKQIFPALQAMIRHGHLDIPIIGVGRSAENLDCWGPAEADKIVASDGGWHNPALVQETTKGAAK